MPSRTRADLIARFERGEVQVLTNCMVLTEGFDSQPVGCIGILRPMLHKGTFIQAVGRGLRRVDPARFPGIVKTDCVVLDFAGAALRHGSLEQEITLGCEGIKPGWVRVNFNYFLSDEVFDYLVEAELPFVVILTKADKLKKMARQARMEAFAQEIPYFSELTVIPFSSQTFEGVERVRQIITELAEEGD